jgi:phospholipase C
MAPPLTRRDFIKAAASASAAGLLPGCGNNNEVQETTAPGADVALPDPADSGIDHLVVVMMENRSFDHMLGWVPGADGRQEGLSFADANGELQATHRLPPDFQGCGLEDPHHGYDSGRVHYADGRMDGFLRETAAGDLFPVGYYAADDVPFFKGCAAHWTICDRYHSGILASTQPNRMYMHCGQTDRKNNPDGPVPPIPATSTLRTVWDAAADAGVSAGYFFSNLPYTALWEQKYLDISKPIESFAAVALAGALPSITYVDPFFYEPGLDLLSNDDHPHADIRNGQAFLNSIYDILRSAPTWQRTLLVINYDEWGGFFDHVPPPLLPVTDFERDELQIDGRAGFRVPCILIGPRARRGHVARTLFTPNSIHKFMEWRWGLEPLGVRSGVSSNLAVALDFAGAPNLDAPAISVPLGPFGDPMCEPPGLPIVSKSMAAHFGEVEALRRKARAAGFRV